MGPESWLPRLAHPDASVRARTALALRDHAATARGDARSRASLARALLSHLRSEEHPGAAFALLSALSALGDDADDELRAAASADGLAPAIRAGALRASILRAGDDPRLDGRVAALFRELEQPHNDLLHEPFARALAELPQPRFLAMLDARSGSVAGTAVALRAVALRGDPRLSALPREVLLRSARGTPVDPRLFASALAAVESLRLRDLAPLVADTLRQSADRSARPQCLRTLAALGEGDASLFTAALEDPLTRHAALSAIAILGLRSAAPAVRPLLAAPWSEDRRLAAETLEALGEGSPSVPSRAEITGDTPSLVARSERSDHDGERAALALELGSRAGRGDPEALAALRSRVEREADDPSPAAVASLVSLVRAGESPEAPTLLRWLRSADPLARQVAVWSVPRSPVACGLARPLMFTDPDEAVRAAAMVAWGRCARGAALGDLASLAPLAVSGAMSGALSRATAEARSSEATRWAVGAERQAIAEVEPGSVWAATLPDGGVAIGVAGRDGRAAVEGLTAFAGAPRRVDAPRRAPVAPRLP